MNFVVPGDVPPTQVFKEIAGSLVDVTSSATISGQNVSLKVTDGGLGDEDGVANGEVVDPVVFVNNGAQVPPQLNKPNVQMVGTGVRVDWVAPAHVTAAVAYYTVLVAKTGQGPFLPVKSGTCAGEILATSHTCLISQVNLGINFVEVVASNSAGTGRPSNPAQITMILQPQTKVVITNHKLTGVIGSAIPLTISGGSGVIAPLLAVSGNGCSISGFQLLGVIPGKCTVTAWNPANGTFSASATAHKDFTFLQVQTSLAISNVQQVAVAGTPVSLQLQGGSGSGGTKYTATGSGCRLSGSLLNTSKPTTCVVIAYKNSSGDYAATSSSPVTFTFLSASQQPLSIVSPVVQGTAGTPLRLSVSGGSGAGRVTFATSSLGCSVQGNRLMKSSAGFCTVSATKAGLGIYGAVKSAPMNIYFRLASPR
jgi:hypothetical protein